MSKRETQYRQGDVLIVAVTKAPKGVPIPADRGRFILAYGEATGHAHAVAADGVEFFREEFGERRRFLLIEGGQTAEIRHEEHATVELPPGLYEVRQQREFLRRGLGWARVVD